MTNGLPGGSRPGEPLLHFNGIDARTGRPLLPALTPRRIAEIARGAPRDHTWIRELQTWVRFFADRVRRGPRDGVDPDRLEQAGWGVIFPQGANAPALREALRPLLDHRRAQAAAHQERRFRELAGEDGYREGETKVAFLARHGAGPGPVDPERVPYYLLLVGDPEEIPFSFQYQLDVQHAVGRLCFDTLEEYRRYAESVVAAETGQAERCRRAAFFATVNPDDDGATRLSCEHLAEPLAERLRREQPSWAVETALAGEATRGRLADLLAGREPPAFLFTACHGLSFPAGDPLQREHQGALICQDWPGLRAGRVDRAHYFAGEDVGEEARVHGLVAFCFACYGAGTPRWDDFDYQGRGERRALSPRAFLGRLPQRLLGHPRGGALAVIGHVERAWGFSFLWRGVGRQLATFEDALQRLLVGQRVGWAMELFHQRYAELASDLAEEVESLGFGKKLDEELLADLWTASHDARNYTIVGDPAVRLAVSGGPAPQSAGG